MTRRTQPLVIVALLAAIVPVAVVPATAQDSLEFMTRYGGLGEPVLHRVKAAAIRAGGLAVLTDPAPAVHRFAGGEHTAFGREGEGPAELSSPADMTWSDGELVVVDVNLHKLVSFTEAGEHQATRTLNGEWADRVYLIEGDTILGLFTPMAGRRAVVRIRGSARDTLLAYGTDRGEQVRLEAEGAPSLTLSHPFTPRTRWTVLADGVVAAWQPSDAAIVLYDRATGGEVGRIDGVGGSYEVTETDREAWLREHFVTAEFMGRRVFEPLLPAARDRLEFPDRFPPVLELLPDPSGAVWIRKTTPARGEVWALVGRDARMRGTLRLPAGRELLYAGRDVLATHATDELEVEYVELYRRPGWAGER